MNKSDASVTGNLTLPQFSFVATQGLNKTLEDYRGKKIVLYFYPKDHTPGCTCEAQEFRDLYSEFRKLNTVIFGVSRDSLDSHEKFKTQHELPFELISDTTQELCELFKVVNPKKFFSKTIIGLERSTFLLSEQGQLLKTWKKVKAQGHAQEVLQYLHTHSSPKKN